jgi:hypothetical protein
MRTEIKILLITMAIVTLTIYWRDVLAAVDGMTPLEIAEFLWMVTVKATVLAILAWIASTLPHIIKPWLRLFRRRGRQAWRSGPNAQWQKTQEPRLPRLPRLTAEQKFWLMMARANQGNAARTKRMPVVSAEEEFEFGDW